MRIIISLLLLICAIEFTLAQDPSDKTVKPVKTEMPSKSEMQSQMNDATNEIKKEIADLEKQLKASTDADEKKSLHDQINMLQKQMTMMEGLKKNVSGISDKVYKEAANEENAAVAPKRDVTRISILPKKKLNEAELAVFIRNVHAGVEKIIPPSERAEALNIYNETKAKYKTTAIVANASNACWMLGHWEKALFIMGKACMEDMNDADDLNNYAAFLIMAGGEQAALPILLYLNAQYPNNSTILNNIGQAWFGLGDLENAKKYLDSATILYPNHSMANSTFSDISVANNDPAAAISELKASLKETYDPEKEARLKKLGYEIKFADMPPLNYPMAKDPYGFLPLINSWNPDKIQGSIADAPTAIALQAYVKGVQNFDDELEEENVELDKKVKERVNRLSQDSSFRKQFLDPYNCPGYLLAARSLQLYCFENGGLCLKDGYTSSPFRTGLWLPLDKQYSGRVVLKPISALLKECEKIWMHEVEEPMAALSRTIIAAVGNNCADQDAKMDAFLAQRKAIYKRGVTLIQNEFNNQDEAITNYIKYSIYADMDDPDEDYQKVDPTYWLLAETDRRINRRRARNKYYKMIISLIVKSEAFEKRYYSNCGKPSPDVEPNPDNVKAGKVRSVKCEYIVHLKLPGYDFELKCNNITEKTDPKLEKRYPNVNKGAVNRASRRNSSAGPVQSPKGPSIINEIDDVQATSREPLTFENKDISQFGLEYNKWGNLVGLNFQLSEDGSTLKDPDSVESGVDSRWSWNAIASPKKGFMNKLLLK